MPVSLCVFLSSFFTCVLFQVRGRWEELEETVVQFIMTEAAAENYVGVVVFGSTIENFSNVLPLSDNANRVTLASAIPPEVPENTGAKNLLTAITRGTEVRMLHSPLAG